LHPVSAGACGKLLEFFVVQAAKQRLPGEYLPDVVTDFLQHRVS